MKFDKCLGNIAAEALCKLHGDLIIETRNLATPRLREIFGNIETCVDVIMWGDFSPTNTQPIDVIMANVQRL